MKFLATLLLSLAAFGASAQTMSVTGIDSTTGKSVTIVLKDAKVTPLDAVTTVGTWTTIATEHQTGFTLTTPTTVRFGLNNSWVTKTVPAGTNIACALATFGNTDPVPGTAKVCQVLK